MAETPVGDIWVRNANIGATDRVMS